MNIILSIVGTIGVSFIDTTLIDLHYLNGVSLMDIALITEDDSYQNRPRNRQTDFGEVVEALLQKELYFM